MEGTHYWGGYTALHYIHWQPARTGNRWTRDKRTQSRRSDKDFNDFMACLPRVRAAGGQESLNFFMRGFSSKLKLGCKPFKEHAWSLKYSATAEIVSSTLTSSLSSKYSQYLLQQAQQKTDNDDVILYITFDYKWQKQNST